MISETMPLNQWPIQELESLLADLRGAQGIYERHGNTMESTEKFISIVKAAISDVEFESKRLPL